MEKFLFALFLCSGTLCAGEMQEETDLRFAFYSSAWGENTNDGLRLVALNSTSQPVRLDSIQFLKNTDQAFRQQLQLGLEIPPSGYADMEIEYVDLLGGNECITRTMAENWKLVEISNYTLNPSVRNLIIEDTDSFRIYQCVEDVLTTWTDLDSNQQYQVEEWVLFHFETRQEY